MKKILKRELPAVGTELVHYFYKEITHKAQIVKDVSYNSGKAIEFKGRKYPTLTAAAISITGKSTNGWTFWELKK